MSSEAQAATEAPGLEGSNIFIARQPIFRSDAQVHAYELLFRNGGANHAQFLDGNAASSQVISNAFIDMDMEEIAGGRPVFLNLTLDFLTGKIPMPLPPQSLVIEILEDIDITDELLSALRDLSAKGHTLALDDYEFTEDKEPLFEIIDLIKVDVLNCDRDKMPEQVARLKQLGIKLLAEKVEDHAEFEYCKQLGFDYFQGYYFSKPELMSGQAIKPNRLAVLRILAILQNPDCQIDELEQLISNDVSISHKILRIINSALYNFSREILSVKQAIVGLGLKTIRDWLVIITLTDIDDKPRELITLSLQRARMMHNLGEQLKVNPDAAFTTGLFATIDALMDRPMEEILGELPLAQSIVDALLQQSGELGDLLQVVFACERGEMENSAVWDLSGDDLRRAYLESVHWTHQLMSNLAG